MKHPPEAPGSGYQRQTQPDRAQSGAPTGGGSRGKVHHVIYTLMQKWLEKFDNNLMLGRILKAMKKKPTDLPCMQGYLKNGKCAICMSHLLTGHCGYADCNLCHVTPPQVPGWYAREVCAFIQPGMTYIWKRGLPDPATGRGQGGRKRGRENE